MIHVRLSAFVAFTILTAGVAAAQQTTGPLTRSAPAQSVQKPTAQVTATITPDVATVRTGARNKAAMLSCQGPMQLTVAANDKNDGSKGYRFTMNFTEATSATTVAAGQCWREGGFTAGSLNMGTGKGEVLYETKIAKCPIFRSIQFDGGKVATFPELADSSTGSTLIQLATTNLRQSFETKWITIPGAGANKGTYSAEVPVDVVFPAIPSCRM